MRWKFTSDGSVNGWGWRFTVYPIVTYAGPHELGSDRAILSQPSVELVMCLLDARLVLSSDRNLITRLAAALASCAQLSSLGESKTIQQQFIFSGTKSTNYTVTISYKHITHASSITVCLGECCFITQADIL